MDKLLTSRHGPWVTGGILGLLAVLLVKLGNPGNMGFCVACFTRDIAGALSLHHAAVMQYLRPEIPGFILGAFFSSLAFREYSPQIVVSVGRQRNGFKRSHIVQNAENGS